MKRKARSLDVQVYSLLNKKLERGFILRKNSKKKKILKRKKRGKRIQKKEHG